MVYQNEAYKFQKRGIFYFSKRVPSDLKDLYKVGRLTYSLKTKCPKTAEKQVRDALHKLELIWNRVRMDKALPCSQVLVSATNNQINDLSIKFTEAARLYLESKVKHKGVTFYNSVQRATRYLISTIGDKNLASYTRANANYFRDYLLNTELPYVSVHSYPWRPLKTKGSKRDIPLVGKALWSAKRIKEMSASKFAFPRYNTSTFTSTNTASASLNKWFRSEGFGQYTMHSFRHSLRDRLRYVACPSEITDQIGGWSNKTIGQNYGIGYRLYDLNIWMQKLV